MPLGLPSMAGDYIGQIVQAVGTIAGILIPTIGMLISHRKSVNEKFEALKDTVNKRAEEFTHTMAAHELDDERRFGEIRSSIDSAGDTIRREFGETAGAIRQHMHQMELQSSERRLEVERELQNTRHTLYGRLDQQAAIQAERSDGLDERIRGLESRRRSN